jgi:hypothetical protein
MQTKMKPGLVLTRKRGQSIKRRIAEQHMAVVPASSPPGDAPSHVVTKTQ